MFGTHDLSLFILSGLLLNIAPGPDSILIMTRSATQGWRAGSAVALGIGAGTCVHIIAAALGLSAVLATSALAFTAIKWIGAAYLVYMGLTMLLSNKSNKVEANTAPPAPMTYTNIFAQGFLTNILNPKVALFFLAFVPQFITPTAEHKALAFIVLGSIFNFNGMLWCHFLAFCTTHVSKRFSIPSKLVRWLNRGIGALFLSFGIRLAMSER